MILSSRVQIQSHWQLEKIEGKQEKVLYKWALVSVTRLGKILPTFYLNNFYLTKQFWQETKRHLEMLHSFRINTF